MTLKRIAGLLVIALLALVAFYAFSARAATLLPPGKQVFNDANGNPLAGGSVYFYVPGTTTPKDTYQDPGATILNANPVILNGSGQAIIYGTGSYRQIVKDSLGNTIWDQLTADTAASSTSWAGTSGGTANNQTVAAANFTSAAGQIIGFVAGFSNTGALALNPNGAGGINVLKDQPSGPVSLTGGEVVAGNIVQVLYDATLGAFHLITTPQGSTSAFANLASATTTDLGSIGSRKATITGTATVTSFGSSASTSNPVYDLRFSAGAILTHNSTSLTLPGGANILTATNDYAQALYLGSGNWQVVSYQRATAFQGIAGEIRSFAMNACPGGWVAADGTNRSRTSFPTLFAALGTTWGTGDGSTTFGTPDTRGNFLRGWDNGAGVDAARAFASLQTDDLKSHTHPIPESNTGGGAGTSTMVASAGPATGPFYTGATSATGGTETRPRNIAILYCLKI